MQKPVPVPSGPPQSPPQDDLYETLTSCLYWGLGIIGFLILFGVAYFLLKWSLTGRIPTGSTSSPAPSVSAKDAGTMLAWVQVFKD